MNCKKADEYLVDYLYQELPAKKTLEIEKHLRSCTHCTKTLESWRAIHRAYQRNAEEPQIAPYFKQKILAAAEEELSRPKSWSERFTLGMKLATIPIAIFVIVLFLNQQQKEIASVKPEQPPAVVSKTEPYRDVRPQAPAAREQKQDTFESGKRSEMDYAGKLKAQQPYNEQELRKDIAAKKEEEAADSPVGGVAMEPAPSSPAASAPVEADERYAAQSEYGQEKPQPQAVTKGRAVRANEQFRQAQQDLEKNNISGWKTNVQDAVVNDDNKALASDFYAAGNSYQNRGEHAKAIAQYELLRTNYRNYQQMDDALLRLGDSYAEVGQFDEAVKAYRQVSRAQQKVAMERIQRLQKKQEAQEQLRSLGYVGEKE